MEAMAPRDDVEVSMVRRWRSVGRWHDEEDRRPETVRGGGRQPLPTAHGAPVTPPVSAVEDDAAAGPLHEASRERLRERLMDLL